MAIKHTSICARAHTCIHTFVIYTIYVQRSYGAMEKLTTVNLTGTDLPFHFGNYLTFIAKVLLTKSVA